MILENEIAYIKSFDPKISEIYMKTYRSKIDKTEEHFNDIFKSLEIDDFGIFTFYFVNSEDYVLFCKKMRVNLSNKNWIREMKDYFMCKSIFVFEDKKKIELNESIDRKILASKIIYIRFDKEKIKESKIPMYYNENALSEIDKWWEYLFDVTKHRIFVYFLEKTKTNSFAKGVNDYDLDINLIEYLNTILSDSLTYYKYGVYNLTSLISMYYKYHHTINIDKVISFLVSHILVPFKLYLACISQHIDKVVNYGEFESSKSEDLYKLKIFSNHFSLLLNKEPIQIDIRTISKEIRHTSFTPRGSLLYINDYYNNYNVSDVNREKLNDLITSIRNQLKEIELPLYQMSSKIVNNPTETKLFMKKLLLQPYNLVDATSFMKFIEKTRLKENSNISKDKGLIFIFSKKEDENDYKLIEELSNSTIKILEDFNGNKVIYFQTINDSYMINPTTSTIKITNQNTNHFIKEVYQSVNNIRLFLID